MEKAKTIFVDFKNKQVTGSVEGEYVGRKYMYEQVRREIFGNMHAPLDPGSFELSPEAMANSKRDPSAYLISSMETFDHICDSRGLFNIDAYGDPQVRADALSAIEVLKNEISNLSDTLNILEEMLETLPASDNSDYGA